MRRSAARVSARVLSVALGLLLTASLAVAGGVKVGSKTGVGSYLTDDNGMTLYIFKKDMAGKSACAGPCVDKWPLFYQEKVEIPAGVAKGDFGVITRDDGKKQSTYKGMPLYYFYQDKAAGDTNGQGFGNIWYVATP